MRVKKVRPWIKVMVVVVGVVLAASFLEAVFMAAFFTVFMIWFFLPLVFGVVAGLCCGSKLKILRLCFFAAVCVAIFFISRVKTPNFGPPQDIASTFAGAAYNFKRVWVIGWTAVGAAVLIGSGVEVLRWRNKSFDPEG